MSKVFVCHSSQDKSPIVNRLVRELQLLGFEVWLDESEIHPGQRLRDRINNAIAECRSLIAVLTPQSVASEWVRTELDSAMIREIESRSTIVIPALFGAIELTDLPLDLRGKLCADFRRARGAKYLVQVDRLARAILGENDFSLASALKLDVERYKTAVHGDRLTSYDSHPIQEGLSALGMRMRWYLSLSASSAGIYYERARLTSRHARIILPDDCIDVMTSGTECRGESWLLRPRKRGKGALLELNYLGDRTAGHFTLVLSQKSVNDLEGLAVAMLDERDQRRLSELYDRYAGRPPYG